TDRATPALCTLSLHDALPIFLQRLAKAKLLVSHHGTNGGYALARHARQISALEVIRVIDGPLFITSCLPHESSGCEQSECCTIRSEEHTSELQSRSDLVCRLL